MWSSFLRAARQAPPAARGPAGRRAYVIGDVHGRADLLSALLEEIRTDNARRPARDVRLIFLGDVIDRGPGSREVIALIRRGIPGFAAVHGVMGNHEESLLLGLGRAPWRLPGWLAHGGLAFARSYGLAPAELIGRPAEDIADALLDAVPAADIACLEAFRDYIRFGDYLLVHAGIRPGRPLEAQARQDLRWIREPFLSSRRRHGCMVVHGHTAGADVCWRPNRIGLDTGAYRTGVLSALMIDEDACQVLQARGAASPGDPPEGLSVGE